METTTETESTTETTATEQAVVAKLYGWATVDCGFTNSIGFYRHYKPGEFFEVTANDVTPDDDSAKHFIFASSEAELLNAVSEYKLKN